MATRWLDGSTRRTMIVSLRSPMFSRSPKAPAYGEFGSMHAPLSAPVMRKFCASGSTGGNVAVGAGAASVTGAAVAAGGDASVVTAAVSTPLAPAAVAAAPSGAVLVVAAPAVVVTPAVVVAGVVVSSPPASTTIGAAPTATWA